MVRSIGYWSVRIDDGLPSPADLIDRALDPSEARWVASYLDRGLVAGSAMGAAECRICGARIGTRDLTDLVFIWPEGLGHYVLAHQLRLPAEFVRHIDARLVELEQLEVDDSWWIRSTRTATVDPGGDDG